MEHKGKIEEHGKIVERENIEHKGKIQEHGHYNYSISTVYWPYALKFKNLMQMSQCAACTVVAFKSHYLVYLNGGPFRVNNTLLYILYYFYLKLDSIILIRLQTFVGYYLYFRN